MASPVEIRGVLTDTWHDELHKIVYNHICDRLGKAIRIRPKDFEHLPESLASRAGRVDAVQTLWRKKVREVTTAEGCVVTEKVAEHMEQCIPAGVSFTPHRNRTCRKYLCCPFCFYRKVSDLADILNAGTWPGHEFVLTVQPLYLQANTFPDRRAVMLSSRTVRKIAAPEYFKGGVSLRYLSPDKNGVWCLVLVMVGLVPEGRILRNTHNLPWRRYPATESGVRAILKNHIRFPAAVLQGVADVEVWNGLMGYLRHMRSGKLTNREKSKNHVLHLQRSAFAPTDVGVETGSELRQLL